MLAWVAGVLFVTEGFYLLENPVALPFGSVGLPSAGALSATAGLAVIFLAAFYRTYADFRAYFGALIVLLSAGDLWFGGGFWVGSVVGIVAGVLILVLPPYGLVHQPR